MSIPGVFIIPKDRTEQTIEALNNTTRAWELKAARGECSWICSSCCSTFPEGMPDRCPHSDDNGCTEIIQRDKKEAQGDSNG